MVVVDMAIMVTDAEEEVEVLEAELVTETLVRLSLERNSRLLSTWHSRNSKRTLKRQKCHYHLHCCPPRELTFTS